LNSRFTSSGNIEKAVIDLLNSQGVEVHAQSGTEVAIYCPFHDNHNSPACYINTKTGLWQCFNPSCGKKGNFRQLYKHMTGKTYGREWILDPVNLQRELDLALVIKNDEELTTDSIEIDYRSDQINKLQTLIDRGYELNVLEEFEIGYSSVKDRVVIPVRDPQYKLVGLIGRAIHDWQDPRYLYNKGFKRADVLFNIQNAKRYDSVIICEGSLDAIKIAQAGFKNVVATLGAKVSPNQVKMVKKYFDSIVVFSDNDDAGAEMRRAILDECRGKEMFTVSIPDGLKDPGDMTEQQIKQAIMSKQLFQGELL
jgi:DNA primase